MTEQARLAVVPIAAACLVGLGAYAALAGGPPVFGAVPEFSLTAHDGSPFTRAAIEGRGAVLDFIFTRCAEACPAMTEHLAAVQAQAPPGLAIVSFTVDPTFDTAEVLSRYAKEHRAAPGWWFVTGPVAEVYDLATRGFKLTAAEVPEEERLRGDGGPFLHSSKFVLVDGQARIRGYYESEDPVDRRRLLRDAALAGPFGRWPRINASLNAASAALLLFGYAHIRAGRRAAHRACMVAALLASTAFLAGYLYYHSHVGSVRFPGEGLLRTGYLALLGTHTVLAAAIVPLVAVTLTRALRGRFPSHRAIARVTLPLWTYVSVTGVVVYCLLYRL